MAVGLQGGNAVVTEHWPAREVVDDNIPERARYFLQQAIDSTHAPAGAVILAAAAVDAMLKTKDYTEGSLYSRIDAAKDAHMITAEMATWAHEIRLDANEQRHADLDAPLPTSADVRKCIAFAQALGQFLFVLPSFVSRGRSLGS